MPAPQAGAGPLAWTHGVLAGMQTGVSSSLRQQAAEAENLLALGPSPQGPA